MKEIFAPTPEASQEKEISAEAVTRQIEKGLVDIEVARATWVDNLNTLEQKFPHNDIMLDQKTYSYDVTRNAWLAELMKLDQEETELRQMLAGLDRMDAEA